MNKEFVLSNLREAREEIDKTIEELESDPEYEEPEFLVAMMHLYHHVNFAWNARNSTQAQSADCSDGDFNRWGHYPTDLPLMLLE
jgi:hypothetical protein